MSKHTPGPWHYDSATQTLRAGPGKNAKCIADFEGCTNHPANKNLIQAAPWLLEALKSLVDYIENYYHDDMQCDHDAGQCGCMLKVEVHEAKSIIRSAEVK